MIRIGITGTDTGVGKTIVATALLALWRDAGLRVAAMKPVETGVTAATGPSDAERLRELASGSPPLELVRPYVFPDSVSPLAAAERAGRAIEPASLDSALARLGEGADALVVEGAGGALAPITTGMAVLDLFRRWSLDVIIVAANRLGVLNHALLTERATRAAGLTTRAIVLVEPAARDDSCEENATLLARLATAPVRVFPRLTDPADRRALAAAAASARLDTLVSRPTPTSTHAS